jgi:hypothetical protein
MKVLDQLWPQTRAHARWLPLVYAPGLALIGLVAYVDAQTRFPASFIFRDAASTVEEPFFLGAMSNLGAVLWFAAGAICLFAAGVLRRIEPASERASFFFAAGLLTVMMALDDLLQFHEEIVAEVIFARKSILGLFDGEIFVMGFYVLALSVILIRWNGLIRTTDYLFLLVALAFFILGMAADRGIIGGSVVKDKEVRVILEDGCKFLGITGWLHYFARSARQQVLSALSPRTASDGAV